MTLSQILTFAVIKLVGAAYLGYLGVKALVLAARRGPAAEVEQAAPAKAGAWAAFRQGVLLTRPRVRRAVDGVTGAALLGLGVRLALTRA